MGADDACLIVSATRAIFTAIMLSLKMMLLSCAIEVLVIKQATKKLSKDLFVQECDANEDDKRCTARFIKTKLMVSCVIQVRIIYF